MIQTFKRFAVLVAAGVPALLGAAPEPIILDNPDATFEPASWVTAQGAGDRYGPNYRFHPTVADSQPTATATFRPNLPEAGNYHVDISFPRGDNRATNTPWQISYDGGMDIVTVNQQLNGGKWIRIADNKPFAAGTKGFARVLNNSGSTGAVVIADAVRFVPAIPGAPSALAVASSKPGSTSPPPQKPGFALDATASPGGNVIKSPNASTYAPDALITVTAVPLDGYVFEGWSGDFSTLKNPLKVTMNGNRSLRANFVPGGIGVVMDNADPGVRFEPQTAWTASPQAFQGTRYKNHHSTPGKPKFDASAKYIPNIPKSGKYDVYIWYAKGVNRTIAAPWSVSHKGGVVKTAINQRTLGGEWVPIASDVQFEAGEHQKQYAMVTNETPDSGVMIIADAVAFVYLGD